MKFYLTLFIFLIALSPTIAQSSAEAYYMEEAMDLIEAEEYNKALKSLKKGLDKLPESAYLYNMRGTLLEGLRRYDEALLDFTAGYEKAQDDGLKSLILSNRGGTKCRIRDFEGAYIDLVSSLHYNDSNIDALNNLAATCDELNKKEEAIKYLKQITSFDSTYVPAYINLGFTYQNMGEHEKAIHYFDNVIALDSKEALGYSNRAFSRLKTGDLSGAMEDINQSINIFPTNSYAFKIKALIEIEEGNIKEACKDLTQATKLGYTRQYGDEVDQLKAEHCK